MNESKTKAKLKSWN